MSLRVTMTPESRLNLICRFLLNLPSTELNCMNRLLYHLDAAYWFYLDTTFPHPERVVEANASTVPISSTEWHAAVQGSKSLATFAGRQSVGAPEIARFIWDLVGCEAAQSLWQNVPSSLETLRSLGPKSIQSLYLDHLITYRYKIPVAGCAIVRSIAASESKSDPKQYELLLIRAAGQAEREEESWGIPKGKLNKNETALEGALRETFEEVGWDPPADRVNSMIFEHKSITVFLVTLSATDRPCFKPMCQNEVSEIRWHPLTTIPGCRLTSLTRRIWPKILSVLGKKNLLNDSN
jgi:ADP-ribose pyrophosphatase YjhB (NUDIX family)